MVAFLYIGCRFNSAQSANSFGTLNRISSQRGFSRQPCPWSLASAQNDFYLDNLTALFTLSGVVHLFLWKVPFVNSMFVFVSFTWMLSSLSPALA